MSLVLLYGWGDFRQLFNSCRFWGKCSSQFNLQALLRHANGSALRSKPVRNGYIGELDLHQESLRQLTQQLQAELDADPDATGKMEDLTSELAEAVSEYNGSQANIRKVMATCLANHTCSCRNTCLTSATCICTSGSSEGQGKGQSEGQGRQGQVEEVSSRLRASM